MPIHNLTIHSNLKLKVRTQFDLKRFNSLGALTVGLLESRTQSIWPSRLCHLVPVPVRLYYWWSIFSALLCRIITVLQPWKAYCFLHRLLCPARDLWSCYNLKVVDRVLLKLRVLQAMAKDQGAAKRAPIITQVLPSPGGSALIAVPKGRPEPCESTNILLNLVLPAGQSQ